MADVIKPSYVLPLLGLLRLSSMSAGRSANGSSIGAGGGTRDRTVRRANHLRARQLLRQMRRTGRPLVERRVRLHGRECRGSPDPSFHSPMVGIGEGTVGSLNIGSVWCWWREVKSPSGSFAVIENRLNSRKTATSIPNLAHSAGELAEGGGGEEENPQNAQGTSLKLEVQPLGNKEGGWEKYDSWGNVGRRKEWWIEDWSPKFWRINYGVDNTTTRGGAGTPTRWVLHSLEEPFRCDMDVVEFLAWIALWTTS
ncbi:hypothetical protein EDB86DRAFT_2827542 [Lactarius hatsudake]|nr:hypothetical protein EDB86DRAFT_2827542 [Lactarius hatsudake]